MNPEFSILKHLKWPFCLFFSVFDVFAFWSKKFR